jgi:hypothetical protein
MLYEANRIHASPFPGLWPSLPGFPAALGAGSEQPLLPLLARTWQGQPVPAAITTIEASTAAGFPV